MRYAILGDIHANETALCAVLQDIANFDVDQILCLGDLVGYGASPTRTLAILQDVGAISIRGNHDEACCGLVEPLFFNPSARAAAFWTKNILTSNEKQWLAKLPLTIDLDECSLAHGTYDHAQDFRYLNSVDSALGSLKTMPRPVCFVGHTHLPVVVVQTERAPESPSHTLSARIELGRHSPSSCQSWQRWSTTGRRSTRRVGPFPAGRALLRIAEGEIRHRKRGPQDKGCGSSSVPRRPPPPRYLAA